MTKQYSSSTDHIAVERHYHYDLLGQLTHLTGKTRLASAKPSSANLAKHYTRGHQYQYDKIGRLTQHRLSDHANHTGITEVFAFDPASNRIPVNPTYDSSDNTAVSQSKGRPTTLTTHDSYITYTYDSHGRVLFKTKTPLGKDGKPLKQSNLGIVGYLKSLQLAYNANHELTQSISITQEGLNLTEVTTTYWYDAFGRRISKHTQTKEKTRRANSATAKIISFPVQKIKTQHQQIYYLWDGNRQLQEQTDTHIFTTVYEQDSFEPVARLVWLKEGLTQPANDDSYTGDKPSSSIQVFHYHNDHLGTPNELTNQEGEVIWLADYYAWGETRVEMCWEHILASQGESCARVNGEVIWHEQAIEQIQVAKEHLQPLRFQGQYYEEETGLHYNRFRYFDPDLGMFTTRDPIGLMGGMNVFQYAPNPIGWIDPFGLSKKRMNVRNSGHHAPSVRKSKNRSFEMSRSDKSWPTLFPTGDDPEHDHWRLHQAEREHVGPRQGDFKGTDKELFDAYKKAYSDPAIQDIKVDLRSPDGTVNLGKNIKPKTAITRMKDWLIKQGKLCSDV